MFTINRINFGEKRRKSHEGIVLSWLLVRVKGLELFKNAAVYAAKKGKFLFARRSNLFLQAKTNA